MSSANFLSPRRETWSHLPPLPLPPNPKKAHEPAPKPGRFFSWRKFFIAIFLVSTLITGVLAVGAWRVVSGGLALKAAGDKAERALDEGDVALAGEALHEVISALYELESGVKYFSFLQSWPWIGDQLKGGATTLLAARETAEALEDGVSIFLEALQAVERAHDVVEGVSGEEVERSYASLSEEEKELLLSSLANSLPELRTMQVKLRLAIRDLERLDELNLSPAVKQMIAPLREKLPELIDAVDIIVPFAAIASEYAGLGHEKQFLILFLNNHEIRPGGGFIGVYGLMLIKNGDIVSLLTEDSYLVDKYVEGKDDYFVTPPKALREYLIPEWYFRDSAWSPDFAQTSRDATQLFRQEIAYGGQPVPEISGVVGITPTFIARLLKFVGPVTVEDKVFTSENIAEELEYEVEQQYAIDGIPDEHRKQIVYKVTDVMMERLMSLPPSKWTDFFEILHAGFDSKEFALMSFNNSTQAALEDSGWSGVINPAKSADLMMVVDANLGALKTDSVIKQHITYEIKPHGDGYRATTSINYKNNGLAPDWRTTRYRTYARVYAPLGSVLVGSEGSLINDKTKNPGLLPDTVDVVDELGMTTFGAFTAIEIGEERTLSFTYDLPETVTDAIRRGDYELTVFKQMGGRDNLLTLDLNFGTTVVGALPKEDEAAFGDNVYEVQTILDTDKFFRIRL